MLLCLAEESFITFFLLHVHLITDVSRETEIRCKVFCCCFFYSQHLQEFPKYINSHKLHCESPIFSKIQMIDPKTCSFKGILVILLKVKGKGQR